MLLFVFVVVMGVGFPKACNDMGGWDWKVRDDSQRHCRVGWWRSQGRIGRL